MEKFTVVDGQRRTRSLSYTLVAARAAAKRAGVTRLADVTGLARFGIPVFQAVRPHSRSLSVSQGKGLTRMAAMVSALLEATELSIAEAFDAAPQGAPLSIDADTRDLWYEAPRDALAIRLDSAQERPFAEARNLFSGAPAMVPRDLLSLDFTRSRATDIARTSAGLATGNTHDEAAVAAVAEVLERHLEARFRHFGPRERRACELDLASIADPTLQWLIRRIGGRGFALRAWSLGQAAGIAAFRCVITDGAQAGHVLPPAAGSGCHTEKRVALLRAMLEAIQSRITIVAGARDDLTPADYARGSQLSLALALGGLCFGSGPLHWDRIADCPLTEPADMLTQLLAVAESQSPLSVLLFTHERPHPALVVVHAFAPGLEDLCRERLTTPTPARERIAPIIVARIADSRPVLFVGPSLPLAQIPGTIEVRPPAVCGDLSDLLADPPPAIGLIDGCFEIAPTVWHKEILDLLALGVPVLGGASLGALRAAELHEQGMIGVGAIFESYRDGATNRDDAVMISHAPPQLGNIPLSIALVDAEAALHAVEMPPAERRMLQRIVRTMGFADRTWPAALTLYEARTGRRAVVSIDALNAASSLKQADARLLVAALLAARASSPIEPPPMTSFYKSMRATRFRARR
ncbi:YcaO-like family protein [Sphingomonas sp. BIUV-7]|uniref:YcaO-like family protein n=1 Tax=Sphingomonas natans TaxID=3063330 RepID=A0ABT8YCX4_9SPHN|nr:YcaO-like family protein [Sphingomonas sp. BIUV-7]MDO6416193.1 YcaO-like family protein [Sphingomonas sp. BIUV-7]